MIDERIECMSLSDIRNKLSPFKNLIAMLEGCEVRHSDERINRMIMPCFKEIERKRVLTK